MAENKSLQRRLRRLVLKLAILLFTTLICLLLAEIGVRLMFPQFNPRAQLAFQVMPDHFALGPPLQTEWDAAPKGDFSVRVTFNQYGFRDTKDLHTATPADWFAVGDSFTLGFGVDEDKRYSNLLEQKWHATSLSNRVFNIGIPGNFLDYQRLVKYAQSRGATIHHLIVGVCMDNDLNDYHVTKSDWDSMREWDAGISTRDRVRRWLKSHSALYITASFVLESSPGPRHFLEKIGLAHDLVAIDAAHKTNLSPEVLASSRDELVRLTSLAPDTVVLIIPSRRLWLGDKQGEQQLHTTFVRMCRDAGLRVVDVKPVLENTPNPVDAYFAHDPHWNPRGHVLAAEELSKAISPAAQK